MDSETNLNAAFATDPPHKKRSVLVASDLVTTVYFSSVRAIFPAHHGRFNPLMAAKNLLVTLGKTDSFNVKPMDSASDIPALSSIDSFPTTEEEFLKYFTTYTLQGNKKVVVAFQAELSRSINTIKFDTVQPVFRGAHFVVV